MGSDRCKKCRAELSYCGPVNIDGPTLDCEVCQLTAEIERLKEDFITLANDNVTFYQGLEEAIHIVGVVPEVEGEHLRTTINNALRSASKRIAAQQETTHGRS